MSSGRDTGNPVLRQWLRNERRLGILHYGVVPGGAAPPAAPPAAAAPAPAKSAAPPPEAPATPAVTVAGGLFEADPDLPAICHEDLTVGDAEAALRDLDDRFVKGCTRCRLCEKRTQTVFGVGHARPDIVFVGEGPGADEDAQGEPFVGRAGQLLTRMIAAMTLTREQVYICNVVKCRPPGNRTPSEDEMQTCGPYLMRQLALLRPKVIVTLGRPSSQSLLVTKTPISKLRGQFHDFPPPALAHLNLPSTRLMPTFHPAYLLRNPPAKKDAWDDLQEVMRYLGLMPAK